MITHEIAEEGLIPSHFRFKLVFGLFRLKFRSRVVGWILSRISDSRHPLFFSTLMRRTRPPELAVTGLSENLQGDIYRTVKRAVVIGNGCAGAENQCFGLVHSLGLFDRHLYHVISVQNTFPLLVSSIGICIHFQYF